MVHRVSVIGPPGTGKTTKFVEEIREKLSESVATSVTLSPILEIAKRSGWEAKTLGLRTIYGLAESNLLKEGIISSDQANMLNPSINSIVKRKIAKQLGLKIIRGNLFEIETLQAKSFDTLSALYTKAIFLKGDYNAVYDFVKEIEVFGLTPKHFEIVYDLYKQGKFYDYAFLIYDAWRHEINIAKYIKGSETIKFKYVYIDEAQDLGYIPYKLFEKFEDQYEEFKLFGDPAQTIYTFLGAKPIIMLNHGERIVLNPTHRFGKNIATLGNRILEKLRFPYKIEYKDKQDIVIVKEYSHMILLNDVKLISEKKPNWSIAVLTRSNEQASKIRKILSDQFAPIPIKESQKSIIDRIYKAVRNFALFKSTGNPQYFKKISNYLDLEAIGMKEYLQLEKFREMKISDFLIKVEEKIFGKRIAWIESMIVKLAKGLKPVYVDTIHSAKGLEFDVVMLYDEIPKVIWYNIQEYPEILRDEIFVYYTGITRAKNLLVIYKSSPNYYDLIFK